MTNEAEDDTDPLWELGASLNAGYLGYTMCRAVDEIRAGINHRLVSLTKLLPYLSGMYFSDKQRQKAEEDIFRIQTELAELYEQLANTLVMAPELGRPVPVNH